MAPHVGWATGETLDLQLPPEWSVVGVHPPDLSAPISNYGTALERELSAAPLMREEGRRNNRVAIVVDDNSRWTPVREALRVLLPYLHDAGVRAEEISISVAVGRHRAMDEAAMRQRIGDDFVATYRCFSPPVDDARAYADLGVTPEHIPVRVFRPVAEADFRVLVGSVLPHLQAGFGGGWKLVFPGTSHRSTLGALHRQGIDGDLASLIGTDASHNPMRRAACAAAKLLPGATLSIGHLLGPPGTVLQLEVGRPDAVQDDLAANARRRFQVSTCPPADVVVVSNYPWPGDPLQSFKALIHHSAVCRPGGILVGFFWTDPEEIDRSAPLAPLRVLAAAGPVGGWMVKRTIAPAAKILTAFSAPSAFLANWAREVVAGRAIFLYSPLLRERAGEWLGPVRVFGDQRDLWNAAKRFFDQTPIRQNVEVRIFPAGGLTYCSSPRGEAAAR